MSIILSKHFALSENMNEIAAKNKFLNYHNPIISLNDAKQQIVILNSLLQIEKLTRYEDTIAATYVKNTLKNLQLYLTTADDINLKNKQLITAYINKVHKIYQHYSYFIPNSLDSQECLTPIKLNANLNIPENQLDIIEQQKQQYKYHYK